MRASLRDNAASQPMAVEGRFVGGGAPPTAMVGAFTEPTVTTQTPTSASEINAKSGMIAAALGLGDDKRLGAEGANRARTATRPAMGPMADVGFEPSPGRITAGFGETCAPNQSPPPGHLQARLASAVTHSVSI